MSCGRDTLLNLIADAIKYRRPELRRCRHRILSALRPKLFSDRQRLDTQIVPPGEFVSCMMQLPVMLTTERHSEFVADFHAERSGLGKAQMMRVRWLSPTDKTRVRANEAQMGFVAMPFGLGMRQNAFVDLTLLRFR